MNKQKQSFLLGLMIGSGLVIASFTFIFLTTTITYKSSLFPGKHIALVSHRAQ